MEKLRVFFTQIVIHNIILLLKNQKIKNTMTVVFIVVTVFLTTTIVFGGDFTPKFNKNNTSTWEPLGLKLINPMDKKINIKDYFSSKICHEAVAFVQYLIIENVEPIRIEDFTENHSKLGGERNFWVRKLGYLVRGREWNGQDDIPPGTAIGFFRFCPEDGACGCPEEWIIVIDGRRGTFFHSAISMGRRTIDGVNAQWIRAINGFTLGTGWENVNLTKVLRIDKNHNILYDVRAGNYEPIKVYLSGGGRSHRNRAR